MKLIVIISFTLTIVVLDKVFFPKSARNAWILMTLTFLLGGFLIVENHLLISIANILDVGRPIDVIIYFGFILLVREFFVNRYRTQNLNKQITDLVRAGAIQNPVKIFRAPLSPE